jgi:hypothetical protein
MACSALTAAELELACADDSDVPQAGDVAAPDHDDIHYAVRMIDAALPAIDSAEIEIETGLSLLGLLELRDAALRK